MTRSDRLVGVRLDTERRAHERAPHLRGCGAPRFVLRVEHDDARVMPEFPVELAVTDVHGIDLGGAVLQQAVGEPAGGGAGVERGHAGDVEAERGDGALQLLAAAVTV